METAGTIIGKTTTFKGDLIGNEDLTVKGKVEGTITLESNVQVDTEGTVHAEIKAQSITVKGHVTGNIVVSDKSEIVANGTVIGDIKAPRVVINDGARILGRVEMDVSPVSSSRWN